MSTRDCSVDNGSIKAKSLDVINECSDPLDGRCIVFMDIDGPNIDEDHIIIFVYNVTQVKGNYFNATTWVCVGVCLSFFRRLLKVLVHTPTTTSFWTPLSFVLSLFILVTVYVYYYKIIDIVCCFQMPCYWLTNSITQSYVVRAHFIKHRAVPSRSMSYGHQRMSHKLR